MTAQTVKKVVIAGGGTSGWCVAAALSQQLGALVDITLIESEEIGTVGVGEATFPTIRIFHKILDLDEREFLRVTRGSIKLGISFENWARLGDRYIHSFGVIGKSTWLGDFYHLWLAAQAAGFGDEIGDYCFEHKAAREHKFFTSEESRINYAYHSTRRSTPGTCARAARRRVSRASRARSATSCNTPSPVSSKRW